MQIGEPSFVGSTAEDKQAEEKKEQDKEKTKIRFSLFFDGTLNNRANIEQRLLSAEDKTLTEEEQKKAVELKQKMSDTAQQEAAQNNQQYGGEDTSYGGYFTNVEKMERYIDAAEGFPHTLTTYVEGPGTSDKEEDSTLGYVFGKGMTGVPKKVEQGLVDVVKKIERKVETDIIIEELILDVFGFSRGAAGARYFIFQALKDEDKLQHRLQTLGYTVKKVEVHFAGLYDTVSTYGYFIMFGANNIKALKLNAVRLVKKKVLQLAAADEHREYFSLTDIQSAGKKRGSELFLPGAHSDIGGGYRDAAAEGFPLYEGLAEQARTERARLIASGWYRQEELILETFYLTVGVSQHEMGRLRVERKSISNQYSRIPLHIMARFASENAITIEDVFYDIEKIPANLREIKQKIDAYVAQKQDGGSKAEDWLERDDDWLKGLRHDYLHFSARLATGHQPRTDFWNGQRYRKIYHG